MEKEIDNLLFYYFKNPDDLSGIVKNTDIDYFKSEKLLIDEHEKLVLNFESELLNKELINMLEISLGIKLSKNISNTIKYIDEFANFLIKKYSAENNRIPVLRLTKNLKIYFLLYNFNSLEVFNFLLNLLNSKDNRPRHLNSFEEIYFHFLFHSKYDIKTIYSSCTETYKKSKYQSRHIFSYVKKLVTLKILLSKQLYEYGLENNIQQYPGFAPTLISEMYNLSDSQAIEYSKKLLEIDRAEAFKTFSHFNITCKEEVENIFNLTKDLDCRTVNEIDQQTFLFCKLIENINISHEIRNECFNKIVIHLKSENLEIANATFHNITYCLENYETQRYQLLFIYLNNTKNFKIINDFFYTFKTPNYLFDFIMKDFDAKGFRNSADIFDDTISHFWNESKKEVELIILNMFSQRRYSLLALKIILSSNSDFPYPINFLDIKTEEAQKNAIDAFSIFPYSIDKLIPLILKLKESKFINVRTHLSKELENLVFETYHESLYELVIPHLNGIKDRKLIKSLKNAITDYKNLKEQKSKIKDLSPWENEKDLLDLYYRLEHENNAKISKNFPAKESFLSMTKGTIIVRGKAWKLEDQDEALPLQAFKSSLLINSRAYKNPNNYENELENF
ncbi:hypothetical protein N4T20_08905 [Flavobacterium sp. TR2]|uniref:hypothetical protein n=1 Tax=Flavobacterium sp. TR2 TaxID=2977321 RepID=UPI0021B0B974|nr:hypothetical protein [Flavobacterium sp. TR2]UWY30048.1 hypothetical protein N4T20_08905 [Flavobacterium sp. TR2]